MSSNVHECFQSSFCPLLSLGKYYSTGLTGYHKSSTIHLDGITTYKLCFSLYRVSQKKRNGRFLGLFSIQTVIILTLLDRASSLPSNYTKNIKLGWELFILWVISYVLSFLNFVNNCFIRSVDFFKAFCSTPHIIFLPILFK